MARKISSKDLFAQEDLFKEVRDSADKTIKKLGDFKREIQKIAKTSQRAMKSLKLGDSKSIKTLMSLVEKANKLNKEAIAIDKARQTALNSKTNAEIQLIQIEREKQKLTQEQLKTERLKSQQEKRNNAEKRKTLKLAEQESNAYKKLVKQTRDLKNESKRLGAEMLKLEQSGQKNTQAYQKLSTEYRKVTTAAKQGDQQLKKLDKTVGDNFRNVGNYSSALTTLRNGLAQLGLVMGVGTIVRGAVGVVVDFDQAVADLSAISGQTKGELKGLTDQAKHLGETSQFTATEVTQMQIELAKLGFTNEQIQDSTEAVANFAAATGADIPSAAQVAGSAMRGFGMDASEMERVVSVLGVATTKSALSFESFQAGLSNVAPVANAFGFSIEDTTALLGQLANAGFDASKASVATRNILLNLADSSGDLAQELGRPIRSADDLAGALKELDERGIDLAESLELTDKRSVAAFQTFIEGSDDLVEFRDSITDVSDELKDMADKRLDSVSGQFTLLTSKIQGTILAFAEANGITDFFKTSLTFLTQNMETIIQIVYKVVRAFIVYKTTMMALRVAQRLYNTDFKKLGLEMAKQIPMTRAYRMEQAQLARGVKSSSTAVKGFGRAFASIGIFAIITAVTELAMAWYDVASGAKEAREEEERRANAQAIRDIMKETTDKGNQIREKKYNDEFKRRLKLIDDKLRKDKVAAKNRKEENKLDQEAIKQKALLAQQMANEINDRDQIQYMQNIELPQERKKLEQAQKNLKMWRQLYKEEKTDIFGAHSPEMIKNVDQATSAVSTWGAEIEATESKIKSMTEQQQSFKDEAKEYWLQYDEFGKIIKKETKTKRSNVKVTREINTQFKEQNEYLSQQKKLLFEIKQIQDQRVIAEVQRDFDKEFNKQIENIQKTGAFEVEELHRILDQKFELEKQYIIDKRNFDLQAIDEKISRQEQKEMDALQEERDNLIKNAEGNATKIAEIEKHYADASIDLFTEQIKRREDAETEKVKIVEEAESEILEKKIEKETEYKDMHEELQGEIDTFDEDQRTKELDNIRRNEEAKRAIFQATTQYFLKQSQERVKEIEKEIAMAEKQADFLRELAKEGNIEAEQSLAENQKLIEEANRKREEELKKQARLQLAQSVFTTYSQKLEQESPNPIAETIRDISVLNAFVNSLPTFFEGTEDTGKHGEGVDGKGGFHAILHPNERVIPKDLNEKIGNLSNEDLTRMAIDYQNRGILVSKMRESGSEWSILTSEIKELQSIIKNKPEFSAEVGKITQTSFEILERSKKGNTTVYNRFNVKA